jgi:hypothetical protein
MPDITNIYYHPEELGLTFIDEIDLGEQYEFDIHVVFKDGDGKLYYAHDSGCSCPVPFEGYHGLQDLDIITKDNIESFESTIKGLDRITMAERMQFIDNIRKHLN